MTESGKDTSPKAAEEKGGGGGGLQPKLDHLEEYWDSRKAQLKGRKPTLLPRQSPPPSSSSSSSSSSGKNRGALSMVENSPRSLMASLQLGIGASPAAGIWKVRTNDLAVEEVLIERRAAIVDGRLKGRRLFDDDQTETEDDVSGDGGWGFADFVYCYDSHCDIGGGGGGVSPDCSSPSSSSSFVCDECVKKAVMDVGREDTTTGTTTLAKYVNPEKRRRWTVLMVCVAIGFLIVAGLIRHWCRAYDDQVAVPT